MAGRGADPSVGSSSNRFARNSVFGTAAGVATALGSFVSSVIVAQTLGVEATGIVAFTLWLVVVTVAVCDLGVHQSLSRYLPELSGQGRNELMRPLATYLARPVFLTSIAAVGSFLLYAAWVEPATEAASYSWRRDPVIWSIVGATCALQTLGYAAIGYLRGIQRFDRAALLTVLSAILQIGTIAIGSSIYGIYGALVGYAAGSMLSGLFAFSLLRRSGKLPPELSRRVRRYAAYAWVGALASSLVWSRVEVFFLDRSWGSEAVGLFTVGLTLSNVAAQGPMLLAAGLLPYFAERHGSRAFDSMREAYVTGTRIMAFLVFPICFWLAGIMPAALPAIFGAAFAPAVPSAALLVFAAALASISAVGSNLVLGSDRSDFVFVSGAAAALLSVLAGFLVIPPLGVMGAAVARGAVQLFAVGLGCWFIAARLRCPLPWRDLGCLFLAAAACGLAGRACVTVAPFPENLPVAAIAGLIVYILGVRLLTALPASDIAKARALGRNLPGPLSLLIDRSLGVLHRPVQPT